MVRISSLKYTIDPTVPRGKRIQDMRLDGKPIDAKKKYVVASWASVDKDAKGPPAWEVVAQYLRDKKTVSIKELNIPKLKNVKGDPGIQSA